jgi:hypothetical protein
MATNAAWTHRRCFGHRCYSKMKSKTEMNTNCRCCYSRRCIRHSDDHGTQGTPMRPPLTDDLQPGLYTSPCLLIVTITSPLSSGSGRGDLKQAMSET